MHATIQNSENNTIWFACMLCKHNIKGTDSRNCLCSPIRVRPEVEVGSGSLRLGVAARGPPLVTRADPTENVRKYDVNRSNMPLRTILPCVVRVWQVYEIREPDH